MLVRKGPFFAPVVCLLFSIQPLPVDGQESTINDEIVTRPVISEDVAPLTRIAPVASDGHRGEAFLRRPPGNGPFPAVVLIHGGLTTRPTERLREYALGAYASRFLEAGYVIAVITYRSRDENPQVQSPQSIADAVAVVDYLKEQPYVDANSVVINGSSGGGDLTLEVAAVSDVAAVAPEEPASMLFSGVFTAEVAAARTDWRRAGGRGQDATPEPDYVQFYSEGENELFKEKVARIGSPILIIQGDEPSGLNRFNAEVLIPALEAAGKSVEVRTYPGEVHGFAFNDRSARPAMVLEAFEEVNAFFREAIPTAPTPIDSKFVEHVTLEERR